MKMPGFFHPEEAPEGEEFPAATGRRVDLYRRPGPRLSARNGRGSAADPRRRSQSRPPDGARQAPDAEVHQPVRVVQLRAVEIAELLKPRRLKSWIIIVDLGDVEARQPRGCQKAAEVRTEFAEVIALHKKQEQFADKLEAIPLSNKKLRRRWQGKLNRAQRSKMSQSIRRLP